MKKLLSLFLIICSFSYGEVAQYKGNFGFGVGLGLPTGYDFKAIYRQNEWLSLSLNYNTLKIEGISQTVEGIGVTGGLNFSTPGVMVNYHPFGGNMRLSAGFLYDMGGLNIDADGSFDIEGVTAPVTGNISVKLGRTYPYLGIAYGYDLNSVVHFEISLGTYLLKRPEVNLYFNVGDAAVVDQILTAIGGLTDPQKSEIIALLESSGGNILDLIEIVAQVVALPPEIIMPSEQNLENDIIGIIQEGYDYLPEFLGYNILPVISVGFTFFPF